MNETTDRPKVAADVEQDHYDVFISYRRSTGLDLARSIADWFRLKGVKCFLDQTELLAGQFNEQIYSAIENTRYFVLLLSEGALDRCVNESDWVRHEIEHAIKTKGRDNIIPITPMATPPFPDKLPDTMDFLRYSEVSLIDRQKNFDTTLRAVVENRMPVLFAEIKKRNLLSEHELQLLGTIRWYKRNDGTIDDIEREKIGEAAKEYRISPARLEELISQVEAEVAQEHDDTMRRLIAAYMTDDGRISPDEMSVIDKKAEALQIPEQRLKRIVAEVEGLKKNDVKTGETHRKIRELEKANEQLEASNGRLKEENGNLEKRCGSFRTWFRVAIGLFVLAAGASALLWIRGGNGSSEQVQAQIASEKTRMAAEAQRKVESADNARALAENRAELAEKKAASALATLERTEKSAAETQARIQKELDEVKASNIGLEKARNDAEKRVASFEAQLAAEKKNATDTQNVIKSQAEKDRKGLEERALAAESALKESEGKSARLSSELEASSAEIKRLKAEKAKLAEDLETVRRQKQLDALRDI